MDKANVEQLRDFYKEYLLNNSIPFWLENSLDNEYGGYLTCLDREGKVYNTDKSVWFQGRGTWMFAKLYNTVEKRQVWLDAARIGYEFLTKYCYDKDGSMFFTVTQDGRPLQKRRYMYSENFAAIACAEYYKASGNKNALNRAIETFQTIMDIYRNPGKLAPKINPETRKTRAMAVPMILLSTTQALREVDNDPIYNRISGELIEVLLRDFLKPEEKAMFETVGTKGERLDSPQGRCINPGHSIETAWFLMHEGLYRNDKAIIGKALQILDWSLELGWDKQYGGLFYFVDIEGKPCEQLEWDMKLWWPHTEALYALLLAYNISGDSKYEEWYTLMHDYSFKHFEDERYGEWYGYLHRDGSVSSTLKGSLWKGMFHLPRALLLCLQLLEKLCIN